jgi:hypothetical protein
VVTGAVNVVSTLVAIVVVDRWAGSVQRDAHVWQLSRWLSGPTMSLLPWASAVCGERAARAG